MAEEKVLNAEEVVLQEQEVAAPEPEEETPAEAITEDNTVEKDASAVPDDEEDLSEQEREFLRKVRSASSGGAIKRTTNRDWAAIRGEDNKIITETGETLQADTENSMFKEDLTNLTAAAQNHQRILTGKISGIRKIASNRSIPQYFATVLYGNGTFSILIPSYALFVHNVGAYLDANTQQAVERQINGMIGTQVSFVVLHLDKKERMVIADRLRALETIGRNNFIRIPDGDVRPRVVPGMKAEGTVLRVSRYSVTVNVLGSDSTIANGPDKNEVSWNYVGDCRELYQPGDKVVVKVLAVDREKVQLNDQTYRLVKTKLSIKQATTNPMEKYFDDFAEEGRYLATVSSVTDFGVFAELMPGRCSCLVAFPNYGAIPQRGDERIVQITQKKIDDETGEKRLYGVFVRQ